MNGIGAISGVLLAASFAPLLSSGNLPAKTHQDRNRYCVRAGDGGWTLQAYPPLIDLHARMVFEQVSYDGAMLDLARVRSFDPAYELIFEYKFDEAGKMASIHGLLKHWGNWSAEANLYPDANGKVTNPRVHYFARDGSKPMNDPEDGPEYVGLFDAVPVYRTIRDIPCAEMLAQAEKMDAVKK